MDSLGLNRATLMLQLPLAIKLAEQQNSAQQAGLADLFSMDTPDISPIDPSILPIAPGEWGDEERLQGEKATLGLYLTGHPIDQFTDELRQLTSNSIAELLASSNEPNPNSSQRRPNGRKVTTAGLVIETHHRNTPKGPMGSAILDDNSGRLDIVVFADLYNNCRELLKVDQILIVTGSLAHDEYRGQWSVRAEQISTLEQARERTVERIHMRINGTEINALSHHFVASLQSLLAPYQGGRCAVVIEYHRPGSVGQLRLGRAWHLHPAAKMLTSLKELLGPNNVWLVHGRLNRDLRDQKEGEMAKEL
jgi:DNA polymerase-3 subunit alpha